MARTPSRASARLTLLLQQMEEKLGKDTRGTRATIARTTRLDPAVVSDFLNGKRDNVKGEIIDRVIDAMKLDPRFFAEPWPANVTRHYSEYPAPPRGASQARNGAHVAPIIRQPAYTNEQEAADDDEALSDLSPTAAELKAWEKHVQKHRYPMTDPSVAVYFKRAFILGTRSKNVQSAMDSAINKVADDIATYGSPPGKHRDR